MTDPRMTPTNDAPVTVEEDPYLATIEEFEHEDQRELCRLYNHRPDDSLQFSRSNMREAIRHGRRLAALASAPAEPRLNPTPIEALADTYTGKTEVDRLAIILMRAFGKAEPKEGISQHPASYVATFADMARAVIASAPAGDHIADAGKTIAPAGDGVPAWHGEAFYNALLASTEPVAPAGDGVEAERWRERWYGSDPEKGSAIVTERGNLICYLGGDEQTHGLTTAIVAAHNAALARPRAAVGEQNREAIARLIWNDRHPTGASWDDWERHIAANGGFDGRDSCRRLADRILALQSPPAKVEG